MRVGVMRFSQNFDVDFLEGSAGTKAVELRLGILEGLVESGHQPFILNEVPRDQQQILRGPEKDGYDYRFMTKCVYTPTTLPDLDLIIVEGSVDNLHFGLEQIYRFAQVFRDYDGPAVVYHHGDQNCSVPIGEIKRAEEHGPKGEKVHYWNVFHGIPWRPEQWSLWTPGYPSRLAALGSERRGYHYIDSSRFKRVPIGYSPTFDNARNVGTTWDKVELVYVGAERSNSRVQRLQELYVGDDCNSCRRLLYGNWNDPPAGFDYRGFVPGFGMVYSLLPQAVSTICVTDRWFVEQGMVTTRVVQGIRAGLLTLVDGQAEGYMQDYLPSGDFFINTHEDFHNRLTALSKVGSMNAFLEWQSTKLRTWADIMDEVIE